MHNTRTSTSSLSKSNCVLNVDQLVPVRERQWVYLGPIFAAPLAHIGVTLYRASNTKQQKQIIMGLGILGSTMLTLGMRMYLMFHAGFPCVQTIADASTRNERIKRVRPDERKGIEDPSTIKILSEGVRGFG